VTVSQHGKKGFVIPTKSFVKIGIAKIFCYNNKMFGSINKTFGCCGKIFGYRNKNFIYPLFYCRYKTIFFREWDEYAMKALRLVYQLINTNHFLNII